LCEHLGIQAIRTAEEKSGESNSI